MKRRPTADSLFLVGLLLVFAVLSFQISARGPHDRADESSHPRRSTYSVRTGGWKAFYELLQQSGLPVQRWTRSPSTWPANAQVVITGPEYGADWNEREATDALSWVDKGGTLIVLTDKDSSLTDALNLKPTESYYDENKSSDDASLFPRQPIAFLNGVSSVQMGNGTRWKESPGSAVRLFSDNNDDKKPAVVAFAHGDGHIVAIASAAIADNRHLGKADNARFLAQAIAMFSDDGQGEGVEPKNAKAGAILFDEFHQGYNDDETLWSAIGRPGQMIAYELLVLVLLVAYTASRRFGLSVALPAPSRVSSEYVRSLASLYHRARAADAALESLYASFRRDLCRAVGVPIDTPAAEVAPAAAVSLAAGGKDSEHRLQQLMDTCEAKISGGPRAITNAELLPLARDLEAMRKELHLGGIDRDA